MEDSSNVNVNANAKSPDSETPKPTIPNSISAKRHRTLHHAPPAILYRECLKNHAASIGGLALDGCGEFMPASSAVLTCASPAAASLTCAACGCHRNFHRRELDDPSAAHFIGFRRHQALPPPPQLSWSLTPSRSPSPPHMLLALSSGGQKQKPPNRANRENPNGGKRFRTRFSESQKVKMQAFAEKLGWKMSRSEERAVEEFCNEVGVNRGVLKVWIHNNKQKRDHHHHQINNNNNNMNHENADNHDEENGNGHGRVSFDACNNNTESGNHQNECNSIAHLHVSTNGSSSSS